MRMTFLELCAHFGVEIWFPPTWEELQFLGTPPTNLAGMCFKSKTPTIAACVCEGWMSAALHELVHLLVGPESLKNEEALLVLEWHLMQLLPPEEYLPVRKEFSSYLFSGDAIIGVSDEFLASDIWERYKDQALRKNLILPPGRPNPALRVPIQDWKFLESKRYSRV